MIGQTERFREAKSCEVVRITERVDGRSGLARKIIQETVNQSSGYNLMLFSAMPCTGGSPWQYINLKKPGVAAKVRKHWKLFKELWTVFVWAAELVIGAGGEVVLEWPRGLQILAVANGSELP